MSELDHWESIIICCIQSHKIGSTFHLNIFSLYCLDRSSGNKFFHPSKCLIILEIIVGQEDFYIVLTSTQCENERLWCFYYIFRVTNGIQGVIEKMISLQAAKSGK